MCFVVTCWERADLLALVCGVFCEFVTFLLVSWVRCGTWLYRFLIFATLLLCSVITANWLDSHFIWRKNNKKSKGKSKTKQKIRNRYNQVCRPHHFEYFQTSTLANSGISSGYALFAKIKTVFHDRMASWFRNFYLRGVQLCHCSREETVLVIIGRGGHLFICLMVDGFGLPAVRYYTLRYRKLQHGNNKATISASLA